MKRRHRITGLALGWLASSAVWAETSDGAWSFAPVMGVGQPSLRVLYDGVFKAPFKGRAQITTDLPEDVQGEVTYPEQEFVFYNSLPEVTIGPQAGLEFRRRYGERNDFVIGVGSWEISSKAAISVVFPLQGAPSNEATYERRGDFSYTEYYLGWKRYLNHRASDRNVYFSLTLHEIFDVDYKDEHVFSFKSGPPAGFKRIIVLQSQATGVFALQGAAGLEKRFAERFSISVEGAFAVALRKTPLIGIARRADFNDGDRLQAFPDPISQDQATNILLYLTEDGTDHEEVKLDFSGWKLMAKFNIDF